MAAILNAIKGVGDAVVDTVKDTGMSAICKAAEHEIEKYTGRKIEVDTENVPSDWKSWMLKTGINSIANEDTWDFLENSEYNKRKVELWNERKIDKIVLTIAKDEEVDEYTSPWVVATVDWTAGSTLMTIKFFPRAGNWESDNSWIEPGYKRWWILRDEIVFGLQLYQLPGKCFYKSDWLENFQDFDAESPIPNRKKAFKRWFQFRHWTIFWYGKAVWGWNYQWTTRPPKNPDGTEFTLDSVLSLPSMPSLSMPSIKLPSLPDVSMPSLPDMPSISAPSISAPSLSAPSLSAPDLSGISMPSIPTTPKRPKNPWAAHGVIELADLKVCAKGKKLTLHNATLTNFFQEGEGNGVRTEKADRQKLELEASSAEQAESWLLSLKAVGVVEAEPSGCCVVA